jgi:hypothetical protein
MTTQEQAISRRVDAGVMQRFREEIRRRWGVPSTSLAASRGVRLGALASGCVAIDELLPERGIPRGKLTEVAGRCSSGKTSLVFALVRQTLEQKEGVAWVDPWKAFYAPSAAHAGIPLEKLLLIQPPKVTEIFRAAEHLVRSGAFALVVLDAVGLPGRGVTSPLFRLSRLALRKRAAVVLLTDHPDQVLSLGSAIALRLCIERRSYCFDPEPKPPFDLTGYRIEVEVGKTRVGPMGGTRLVEVCNPQGVTQW